jgi:ATPase subunit of ABC transporter with duplicated ATPase domains
MRVRFVGALLEKPDFLLLDEPTNHLDLAGRAFVYHLIDSWTRGLVVVSHDRVLLARLDKIAELHQRGLRLYGGNWDVYREQRDLERAAAEQDLASAKAKLVRTRTAAQQTRERQERRSSSGRKKIATRGISPMAAGNLLRRAQASTSKLADRHKEKILEATRTFAEAKRRAPTEDSLSVDLKQANVPASKRMIELTDVNYKYAESERFLWAPNLTFTIFGRERIWLKGDNGSGKSTLLDIIRGLKQPTTGQVQAGTERIAMLDQPVSVLSNDLSVLENVRSAAPARPLEEIRNLLGRFLFRGALALKKVSKLSGGERMRAGLACLLGADQAPEILMLDEPANNLDLPSISALVSSLRNFTGSLIVVSHDITFVDDIGVDRSIDLQSNRAHEGTHIGPV